MVTLNPYLNFQGNAEEAFNLYKSVFGGDFAFLQRFKDTPEGPKVPDAEKNMLMHVSLPVGKGTILMATDALDSLGQKLVAGNNFHIHAEAESKEEADKVFKGLSAGGKVSMAMQDTFWGAYFGMLQDRFGIRWMVSYTKK